MGLEPMMKPPWQGGAVAATLYLQETTSRY